MINVNKALWFVAVFRHNSERIQKKNRPYPSIVHRLRECIGNYKHQVLLLANAGYFISGRCTKTYKEIHLVIHQLINSV